MASERYADDLTRQRRIDQRRAIVEDTTLPGELREDAHERLVELEEGESDG